MTSIRVLEVLTLDVVGGTEIMGLSVFPKLDPSRFHVEVAFPGLTRGPISEGLVSAGLRVHHVDGSLARGMMRLAKAGRYDLAHFYGLRVGAVGRLAFAVASPRTIRVQGIRHLHSHDRFIAHGRRAAVLDRAEAALSRLTHAYVANSHGALERLSRLGVPKGKLGYVPNGLDVSTWQPRDPDVVNDPPVVVCVARMVAFKRHCDLLHALAALRRAGVSFRCVLVGSGPLEEDLRQLSRDLEISSTLQFLGQLSLQDTLQQLRVSDIAVLPSQNEGMPRSVMEAMATGLPVVGTDVNGTRDLIVDGQTGYLVPVAAPNRLARALRSLIEDPQIRGKLGRAGRDRIRRQFSLDTTLDSLAAAYEQLVARRSPGPHGEGSMRCVG